MTLCLSTTIIKPEKDIPIKNAIILLHGYGGDGKDISMLTLNWKRFLPNTIFLCPDGHEECKINPAGFQWFDLTKDDQSYILEESKKAENKLQKYIEEEFSEELKKLTRTEGQILVKLIHRQTGKTAFDLIKELRSGWRAFWFNSTAKFFNISLKQEFDPENEKEDYLIEDILQRNFQSGNLEEQEPAIEFDFYELTDKWLGKKDKP